MNAKNLPRPTGVVAPHGSSTFKISWEDGKSHTLANEILRGFCPCAGCQGHSGVITFQRSKNSELRSIQPVGNYALSLVWGDQHDTGIYSFDYIYRLGELQDRLGVPGLKELENLQRASLIAADPSQKP